MRKNIFIVISFFLLCNFSKAQYKGGSYDGYASHSDSNIVVPSSIKQISEVANDFRLFQNFPNPFNPGTSIKFSLNKSSEVTLKVFDINGRLVLTLLDNVQLSSGIYSLEFNASNLSSGIYFYEIQTGKISAVKKMILAK